MQYYPSTAQKFAYGAGAFALVFSAAAAGSLFMITGGIGDIGHSPPADSSAMIEAPAVGDIWRMQASDEEFAAQPPRDQEGLPAPVISYASRTPMAGVAETWNIEPRLPARRQEQDSDIIPPIAAVPNAEAPDSQDDAPTEMDEYTEFAAPLPESGASADVLDDKSTDY